MRLSWKASVSCAAASGLLAGGHQAGPGRQAGLDPGLLPVVQNQVDPGEPTPHAEEPLGGPHVHDQQAVEGGRLVRVGGPDDARDAQGLDPVLDAHDDRVTDPEVVAIGQGAAHEHRAFPGDPRLEARVGEGAAAQVGPERSLGEYVEAQDPQRLPVQIEGDHVVVDHGRARAHLCLGSQAPQHLLVEPRGATQDLVGGAAHDRLGTAGEPAAGARVGEIDGDHHRHPEGDAENHEPGVQRAADEVAQAGQQQ